MRLDACAIMSYSALQLELWYRHIVKEQDGADVGDELGSDVEDGECGRQLYFWLMLFHCYAPVRLRYTTRSLWRKRLTKPT